MTNHDANARFTTDDLGRAIAARLSDHGSGLSHEVTERLKSARMLALEKRRQVATQTAHIASAHGGVAVLGGADAGAPWGLWRFAAASLPLLALVVGLVAIDYIQDDYRAKELADVDVELLTSDLPPAAFTDPGFVQFLRINRKN